jgi:hypothetical protein
MYKQHVHALHDLSPSFIGIDIASGISFGYLELKLDGSLVVISWVLNQYTKKIKMNLK